MTSFGQPLWLVEYSIFVVGRGLWTVNMFNAKKENVSDFPLLLVNKTRSGSWML